jgi:hypothetical protein
VSHPFISGCLPFAQCATEEIRKQLGDAGARTALYLWLSGNEELAVYRETDSERLAMHVSMLHDRLPSGDWAIAIKNPRFNAKREKTAGELSRATSLNVFACPPALVFLIRLTSHFTYFHRASFFKTSWFKKHIGVYFGVGRTIGVVPRRMLTKPLQLFCEVFELAWRKLVTICTSRTGTVEYSFLPAEDLRQIDTIFGATFGKKFDWTGREEDKNKSVLAEYTEGVLAIISERAEGSKTHPRAVANAKTALAYKPGELMLPLPTIAFVEHVVKILSAAQMAIFEVRPILYALVSTDHVVIARMSASRPADIMEWQYD